MTENANTIKVFLPKLIKAVKSKPNWFLVLSASMDHFPLCFEGVPNVHIMPFIPQLDMLTWCNAVITHGGLTTIKECMQNGVPMLIYPTNNRMDMTGNAARITNNKWGLTGHMIQDTPACIVQKLSRLFELTMPVHQPDLCLPHGLLKELQL